MSPNYPLPTIHLNGSGRESLLDGYHEAWKAVQTALKAFAEAGFHPRDYYVQGDEGYLEARKERNKHLANLNNLAIYLEQHIAHLAD